MNQSISDLLLNIDPHYPDFEHFQDGIFNMKPIYYKNSNKIHMEVTLDHVLPFEVWDVFLMRLKKVTKCSIDLHIQVRKAGIQLVELHHYINHFVSMNHRLKIFGDALPTMEEKYLIYHIADEVPRNEAIAHKHVLEAYLKQCGIHYEILIRELNIGQGKIASVQVQEHEDKPVQKIEEKKGYAFKKRKNVEQYAKINLSDISEAMQEVVFSGQIFDIELRQLKSGKHLQLLWVKDETDAIIVKRFERGAITLESLNSLKKGMSIRVYGRSEYDEYMREMIFIPEVIEEISTTKRMDTASEKRVELHCHTKLSEMDGVCDIDEFIQTASSWGWDAIAITDHRVVQGFPLAQSAVDKVNKNRETPMKILYGVEMNMVEEHLRIVYNANDTILEKGRYCVFDLETTGLSNRYDHIIEFGAQIVENRSIIKSIQMFIKPPRPISAFTTNLTSITDNDVRNAKSFEEAADEILAFIGDSVLVAHNASFDYDFLNAELERIGRAPLMNPVIDTLDLARSMMQRKGYRLGQIARGYGIRYDEDVAHRADYDAEVLVQVFLRMLNDLRHIETLNDLAAMQPEAAFQKQRDKHISVYAKNMAGLKELFELITLSHTKYLATGGAAAEPKIVRREIAKRKLNGNLLIGSACASGEIFDLAQTKSEKALAEAMKFYDFIEVQPLENYRHLIERNSIETVDRLKEIIQGIVAKADELKIPLCATGDAHYVQPASKQIRDIYISAQAIGGVRHPLYIYDDNRRIRSKHPDQHLRTTNEMLDAFAWLGDKKAYEMVVSNPRMIASQFEVIRPIKDKLYPPDIEGSDMLLRDICFENAHKKYGPNLPEIVEKRLNRELDSIIGAGYYVVYYISHLLVKKSLEDGYLVGSRGSVGSSFVATMSEITEVNPLCPHYVCPKCHYTKFFEDGSVLNGYDLPDIPCPECGEIIRGDGHDIPFETFLGFEGDKVPDIDLNFSGEYQPNAHAYTKEVFGEDHVYRAGTTGTVAEKTAYGYVLGFQEEMKIEGSMRNAQKVRLAKDCEGVKRTTGQHPGGIVVVPLDLDVHDFTPVQYPANDPTAEWKTTHFDFHQIHDNILKFDILGHVDPTAMKMLERMSGIDVRTIPMNDPATMAIFSGVDSLKIDTSKNTEKTGAAGIPEFGTPFVRGILELTRPTTFDELLKISGLSHGTDVWLGNAKDLIDAGICTLKSVIGCRDDIMVYLLHKGLKPKSAFTIMESVRKGKGLKDDWIVEMKANGVEDWYIDSCKKIKYMFPKAHAVAYVMMAVRIAWFKVHEPLYYYCMFFSIRCDAYDIETMIKGEASIRAKMSEIDQKLRDPKMKKDVTKKDKDTYSTLELALEMHLRGFYFSNIDLMRSTAREFIVDQDNKNHIIPPFSCIDGLGESVAETIVEARKEREFLSKEDLLKRTSLSSTLLKKLESMGVLEGMQEENQLSLFSF